MFKVGDKVVCIEEGYEPYIKLHEVCEIVGVYDSYLVVISSYRSDNENNRWHIPIDSVISYDVYNSPLYQLMKENND